MTTKQLHINLGLLIVLRFMSTSLSELVDNMSGKFNSIECKLCTENNRCEECKKIIEGLIKKVSKYIPFLQRRLK